MSDKPELTPDNPDELEPALEKMRTSAIYPDVVIFTNGIIGPWDFGPDQVTIRRWGGPRKKGQ